MTGHIKPKYGCGSCGGKGYYLYRIDPEEWLECTCVTRPRREYLESKIKEAAAMRAEKESSTKQ